MDIRYTLSMDQRILLACEMATIRLQLQPKRLLACMVSAIGVGVVLFVLRRYDGDALPILHGNIKLGGAVTVSFGWHILDAIVCGILCFFVLYVLPLQVLCASIRTLIRKRNSGNIEFVATIENDGISVASKYGNRKDFFNEISHLICGKTGYHFISSHGEGVMQSIPKSTLDFETLKSFLPNHIKCRILSNKWKRLRAL